MCFLTSWQNDFIPSARFPVLTQNPQSHNDHTKLDKIPKSSDYWPNSEDTAIYNVETLKWNVQLENLPSYYIYRYHPNL